MQISLFSSFRDSPRNELLALFSLVSQALLFLLSFLLPFSDHPLTFMSQFLGYLGARSVLKRWRERRQKNKATNQKGG